MPLKLIIGVAVLVFGAVLCTVLSELIQSMYPDRAIVPDLLFDLLPFVPWLEFATDPIILASIAIMLAYALGPDRKRAGYYFFAVGVGYFGRGILMILTPLGRPTGNLDTFGVGVLLNMRQHGMFPSGHAYLAAVIYLLIDRSISPGLKIATGILCIAEIVTTLLSHGHYSIDLAGGVMLAFITRVLLDRYKDRFLDAPPDGRARKSPAGRKR